MKRLVIISLLIFFSATAYSQTAGLAIQTEKNAVMLVYINGKRCNTDARSFVRVNGNAGMHRVEIKVLHPEEKMWYVVRKEVRLDRGYDFYYKVVFEEGRRPEIVLVKRYPVYSRYYNSSAYYKVLTT